MSLRFDQPAMLWLALLAVPLAVAGWRWLGAMDPLRRVTVIGLRTALVAALALCLAGPRTVQRQDELTVIGVLDLSGSVKQFASLPDTGDLAGATTVEGLRRWFRLATASKARDDRFGLVVFDGKATVISVPVRGDYVDDNLDVTVLDGTDIAGAIRLALAMFPADSARRIVLVSDGSETTGDAAAAAREARSEGGAGVPIDVVPVIYDVSGDVQLTRLEVPPSARPGQVVTVRMVLDATAPAAGRLELRREGELIDLNGAAPGTSRPVRVPAGRSVYLAQVRLGDTPINRFEAVFESDPPAADAVPGNNRAEAFTSTPSRGAALLVARRPEAAEALAGALRQAEIPVTVQPPAALPDDLLELQRYDLVILDDVSAPELSEPQQRALVRHVHDLGGGLIMVGGRHSFGAGGWNGTGLEGILPVDLDPPRDRKLARAALVLVLDKSGSMGERVAGTRSSQQRIANEAAALAVESLRRESLVGVVTFDFGSYEYLPIQPNTDPTAIADRIRAITPDGGTNLQPALARARRMLAGVQADRKLVVCLSDGRSHVTELDDLARGMASEGVTITTIAVGDDADEDTLRRLAQIGGGEFYAVRNPRTLPRVLVDSVQVINTPLIKEVPFSPVVLPTGSALTAGVAGAPPLGGLVITTPRPDPAISLEMTDPDGEPLLALWQIGLGRAAAFTADGGDDWSAGWTGWSGWGPFWSQLARAVARPPSGAGAELTTTIDEGRLHVSLETSGPDALLEYLSVDGTVYQPDGTAVPISLPQTAPGRYETSVPAAQAGTYVVALGPRRGARRLAPVIGGATQPSSAEFRHLGTNPDLLRRIAEISGGRRLDLARPGEPPLFDRSGMEPATAALPAWGALLWLAAGLMLLDVAGRRLAWDAALLRRSLARASGRVAAAPARGAAASAALRSLQRRAPRAPRAAPARSDAAPAPPPPPRPAVPRPRPAARAAGTDPSRIAAALNALRGRQAEPPRTSSEAPPPAPPDPDAPAQTTGELLAARRARRNPHDHA